MTRYPNFQQPFDFSLAFSKNDIDLQADNQDLSVSLDRTSIRVFTQTEPHLQLGFITGSSNLNLDNDPPSAGINLSGYHAGLVMRSAFGNNPQMGLQTSYIYQETKDETTARTVTLGWHEWAAGIFGRIILGQQLELSAGWSYHEVNARRRASGDINDTQSLKIKSTGQGRLGMAWLVQNGGRIGLTIQSGSYQQVVFRFSRKFR